MSKNADKTVLAVCLIGTAGMWALIAYVAIVF